MGAPHMHPKIYEHMKANPGEQFTAKTLSKAFGKEIASTVLHTVKKHHPSTVVVHPLGKVLFAISYKASTNPGPEARSVARSSGAAAVVSDVLVTIPIGDNKSATLDAAAARKVYDQLHALFGARK